MNWLNNGQSVKVPVGNYRIFFKELEGFQTPTNVVVNVVKNETTNVEVEYLPVVNGPLGDKGLFGGGYSSTSYGYGLSIDYVTISSLSNSNIFSNLLFSCGWGAACSSNTRGVFGFCASSYNLQYITFSILSNTTHFGYLTRIFGWGASCSNNERGIFAGHQNQTAAIDYVIIETKNNSTNFGNLSVGRSGAGSCSGN